MDRIVAPAGLAEVDEPGALLGAQISMHVPLQIERVARHLGAAQELREVGGAEGGGAPLAIALQVGVAGHRPHAGNARQHEHRPEIERVAHPGPTGGRSRLFLA